jgi:hypothetical protein
MNTPFHVVVKRLPRLAYHSHAPDLSIDAIGVQLGLRDVDHDFLINHCLHCILVLKIDLLVLAVESSQ